MVRLVCRHPLTDMLPLPCVRFTRSLCKPWRLLMTTKHTPRTKMSSDPTPSTAHAAGDHRSLAVPERGAPPRRSRSRHAHPGSGPPAATAPAAAETAAPPPAVPAGSAAGTLAVPVSAALRRQLDAQAQEDGISPGQLAAELLAEGLVLRAWDLQGRQGGRVAVSGQQTASQASGMQGRGQRHHRQDKRGDRQRAPRPAATNMDDQATFLAYVRQQERQRRS